MTASFALIRVVAVALSLVAAGCSASAPRAIPTSAPSLAGETVTPVPLATSSPVAPEPTGTAGPSTPAPSEPPTATMAAEGGDAVAGSLGSFTWGDGGSDSPWLPGAPIAVGTGESLAVALPGDPPVREWVAKRVAAGALDGAGGASLGHGDGGPIRFAAPAPGAWSVQVDVTFDDDLGSATYYWAVTVT
ncbi:MAG: hypothetical protein ACJ77X_12125 [Chloroflexota bacterium]